MSVRGRGFASLTTIDEVNKILTERITINLDKISIMTEDANKRVLAQDIIAKRNLPGFQRSAMDGYAVIAENTFGATNQNPIQLNIVGEIGIGDTEIQSINSGQAIQIATGAPLPTGADAVVKIEECEKVGSNVLIYNAVNRGKNVADEDEDVEEGTVVLEEGHVLTPWDIGLIEALSFDKIDIYSKPKIATLSTGNELIPSGQIPKAGQVNDSNRPAINAWIEDIGGEIIWTGHCKDEPNIIRTKLNEMSESADLIVTTGGTSAGPQDYLPEIINELGELWVHGIAIRPGKPVAIGKVGACPIISLPGYPLAAFINFYLVVAPVICRYSRYKLPWSNMIKVKLNQQIPSSAGMRDFVRLVKDDDGASLLRITGAGILSSLVHADYMLVIPEDLEGYNKGEIVEVIKLRD